MDTVTALLYATVALFVASYAWILAYHARVSATATVARVRQIDCAEIPLERDTLRYQLFAAVGPEGSDRAGLAGLKQFAFVALTISAVGAGLLTRAYYAVGEGLWLACAALAATALALLGTTASVLGQTFATNGLFSPMLRKYAANRARVVGLLDQLQATQLLNQLARNSANEAASASGVTLADDEPNAILSAAAATGKPAPIFSMPLYQLQLRLLQRLKNGLGITSAKAAATHLNGASGAELFEFLQLNPDGDYALFRALLPLFSAADEEMTTSYDLKKLSAEDTKSDVLHITTDDKPMRDPQKLNYTAEELVALRQALDDLLNAEHAPYEQDFRAHQRPLATALYLAPVVTLYFAFKWAIYRSSRISVALAASSLVALYLLYYSYFG